MSHLYDLASQYNDRIAQGPRAGEIEWIIIGGNMKLVHTERFEKENGMRMRSTLERERRTAQYRQGQADLGEREMPVEMREPML